MLWTYIGMTGRHAVRVEEVVGRRIREIRERQGMTQEQLGQAIGELLGKPWPRQTVSSAEAGRRAFTAAELVAVARALGVYVGILFTPAVDSPRTGIELSPGVVLDAQDVMGTLFEGADVMAARGTLQLLIGQAQTLGTAASGIQGAAQFLLEQLAGKLARASGAVMPEIHSYTGPDGKPRYWFRVDVGRNPVTGRRTQEKKTFTKKKDAVAELGRITAEVADGKHVRVTSATVAELIDGYLKSATFEKEKATARSYSDALRCPRERLGHLRARDVTRADVEDMRDFMLREGRKIGGKAGTPLGARSVIFALGRLQAAFALAVEDGQLVRNPVENVTRPSYKPGPKDTWAAEEVRAFLAAASGHRLYAAFRLSLYGLRRSEVLGLRWDAYDRKAKTLAVSLARVLVAGEVDEKAPKTVNSERVLPLDDDAAGALDELRKRQMAEGAAAAPAYRASGYVVADELGEPVNPEWYSDEFQRVAKRAGVRRITLRNGRHTGLSLMEKAGVPTSIMAAWAGHYSAAFTMAVYVRANPEDLGAGRDALASIYKARESS